MIVKRFEWTDCLFDPVGATKGNKDVAVQCDVQSVVWKVHMKGKFEQILNVFQHYLQLQLRTQLHYLRDVFEHGLKGVRHLHNWTHSLIRVFLKFCSLYKLLLFSRTDG